MRYRHVRVALLIAVVVLTAGGRAARSQQASAPGGWAFYGGDAGGTRYVAIDRLDADHVARLEPAWTYRTGELGQEAASAEKLTFEATPVLFEKRLYLSTAFGKIIALDPATGHEVWTYDPGVDRSLRFSEVASRGVTLWRDPEAGGDAPCAARVFLGTIDARLLAVDAASGTPCGAFGTAGAVDLRRDVGTHDDARYRDYQVTSPPVVVGDLVIIGSSIGDNWNVDTGSGRVRAFDARSGVLRWSWEPLPRVPGRVGAANAWAPMAADPERDLVFVPTSSPSPDFYGGLRPGDNRYANAVVALRASTGEVVWHFQTVHHDLWDYDLAAQPALVTVRRDGEDVPAVVQATKMGLLFVLHRETGEPLFPVEERPVPPSDVPGEVASPTQPFPLAPRPLMPHAALTPGEAWGATEADRAACRALFEEYAPAGLYTPPGLDRRILYPGNASGTNWGSVAYDPVRGLLVLNTSRLATAVQLVPRDDVEAAREAAGAAGERAEFGLQRGAPYAVKRFTVVSPGGLPCNPPPWGTLAAVDLATGLVRWEVPLGRLDPEVLPAPEAAGVEGLPNAGGPLVTSGGLVFIGASMDDRLRAFDVETGAVRWEAKLPRSAMATPMAYTLDDGTAYVVVAAGGHGKMGMPTGDYVVAFRLPAGEP